jgi:hypothetical protein
LIALKRFTLGVAAALALWFAFGFFSAQRACAHEPRFVCSPRSASDAIAIPDPSRSWAFYGHLVPGQNDVFTFRAPQALVVPWNLLVDVRDRAIPTRPQAVLRTSEGRAIAQLRVSGRRTFYEPFSRETYIMSPTPRLRLGPGNYCVVVTMRGSTKREQRYVMAIGEAERFGIGEFPYVLGAIHRIRARDY